MRASLISVGALDVNYYSYSGTIHALERVNLDISAGETFGLVGETGCGKSTLGLAIVRLIPYPGRIDGGEILLEGEDLLKKNKEEMRVIRGSRLSMIFQDPAASLNPVLTVGYQITEPFVFNQGLEKRKAEDEAVRLLSLLGIPSPSEVLRRYPHELSGGMQQRVMIAIALSKKPRLLIADEPTSSLDVTVQAQILNLLRELKVEFGSSILLITHDMGVVAQSCERVGVMYAGSIAETAGTTDIFEKPLHPYTEGLLKAMDMHGREGQLETIPGMVPDLANLPRGCLFSPRCESATMTCMEKRPELVEIEAGHKVACHLISG